MSSVRIGLLVTLVVGVLMLSACGEKDLTIKNYRSDDVYIFIDGGATFTVEAGETYTHTHDGPDTTFTLTCTQGILSFGLSGDTTIVCPADGSEPYIE